MPGRPSPQEESPEVGGDYISNWKKSWIQTCFIKQVLPNMSQRWMLVFKIKKKIYRGR